MRRILILYMFGILSLISCSSNKSISGLYGKCKKNYYACTQILLNEDKTFEYYIYRDVGGANILKGKWETQKNGTLLLNTFEQPKTPKTYYKGSINSERKGKVRLRISDANNPIGNASVKINNELDVLTSDDGTVEFETSKIKTITIHILGIVETLNIDNSNFNEIEIVMRDLGTPLLTNEIIFVGKNKLKIPLGNLSYREFNLKKVKLEEKNW